MLICRLPPRESRWRTLSPEGGVDGRPHVTPLVAVWLADAIYFGTGADEQKAHNLRANSHVVLMTECLGTILSARIMAEFGDDPDRLAHARARKNYAAAASATRPPCASSPAGSSASCTAASKTAPHTTSRPPGVTTSNRQLAIPEHGMSAADRVRLGREPARWTSGQRWTV
jgi:Pyridoxamine 5'-phosphate oxidase